METFQGTAVVSRVEQTVASREQGRTVGGPGYDGYEVWFRFTSAKPVAAGQHLALSAIDREHELRLMNSWYVGSQFLAKYRIAPGASFACALCVSKSGGAAPVTFRFPEIDCADYSETKTRSSR